MGGGSAKMHTAHRWSEHSSLDFWIYYALLWNNPCENVSHPRDSPLYFFSRRVSEYHYWLGIPGPLGCLGILVCILARRWRIDSFCTDLFIL